MHSSVWLIFYELIYNVDIFYEKCQLNNRYILIRSSYCCPSLLPIEFKWNYFKLRSLIEKVLQILLPLNRFNMGNSMTVWMFSLWNISSRIITHTVAYNILYTCSFFPTVLQPMIQKVADAIFYLLVRCRVCRRSVRRYDFGAPTSISISLPGDTANDAERRRLVAMTTRHKRFSLLSGSGFRIFSGFIYRVELMATTRRSDRNSWLNTY